MTAVDFLENAISEAKLNNEIYGIEISKEFIPNIIKQAKELEKQQMFRTFSQGAYVYDSYDIELEFNEYYNEILKK